MLSFYIIQRFTRSNYFKFVVGTSLVLFCISFIILLLELRPQMDSLDDTPISFPTNLPEVKNIVNIFNKYKHNHFGYVVLLFSSAYIFKQSFAIPGSFLLNVVGGAIFGVTEGFLLVSVLTGIGATSCFLMSSYFGRDIVDKLFPTQIARLRSLIDSNQDGLFFYLLFLRMFPMSPNWLLNLAMPLIGIPVPLFFCSVIIGLAPYNFVSVQAGNILSQLTSFDSVFSADLIIKMALAATVALAPGLLLRYFSKPRSTTTDTQINTNNKNHIIEVKLH